MKIIFEIDAIPEVDSITGLLDDIIEGTCEAVRHYRRSVEFETSSEPGSDEYRVKVLGVGARHKPEPS